MPDKLFTPLMRLAQSKPKGSPQRTALLRVLMASVDTFYTESGKAFKIKTVEFARFLSRAGVKPGADMGAYLRDEKRIPDAWTTRVVDDIPSYGSGGATYKDKTLKDYGAKGPAIPRARPAPGQRRNVPKRGPDISKLWDRLLDEMHKSAIRGGTDAGDMYVNMGREYDEDDFPTYLAHVAGDMSMSMEYALDGKAEKLYRKFEDALRTGLYTGGSYERWDWRKRKTLLQEIFADYWHDGMIKAWEKLQRKPKELARLKAIRSQFV